MRQAFGAAVFILTLLSIQVPASGQTWVLDGEVLDAAGDSVEGVGVDLYEAGGGPEVTLTGDDSDEDGLFSVTAVEDPPDGRYDIVLRAPFLSNFIDLTVTDVLLTGAADLGQFTLPRLPGVTELNCSVDDVDVSLSWENGADNYERIVVFRNFAVIALLDGDATTYLDSDLDDAFYDYKVRASLGAADSASEECTVQVAAGNPFVRGDATGDGFVNLADAIFLIDFGFLGGPAPTCFKAADYNDNESVDILDVINLLQWLFGAATPGPDPYPDCGNDVTPDPLGCDEPSDGC